MRLKTLRHLCIAAAVVLGSAGLTEWYSSVFEDPILVTKAQRSPALDAQSLASQIADSVSIHEASSDPSSAPALADSFPHTERTLPISAPSWPGSITEAFLHCLPSIDTGFLRPDSLHQDDIDQLLATDALKESIVEYETDDSQMVRRLVVRSRDGLLSCFTQVQSLFCECVKPTSAAAEGSASETAKDSKR